MHQVYLYKHDNNRILLTVQALGRISDVRFMTFPNNRRSDSAMFILLTTSSVVAFQQMKMKENFAATAFPLFHFPFNSYFGEDFYRPKSTNLVNEFRVHYYFSSIVGVFFSISILTFRCSIFCLSSIHCAAAIGGTHA